MHIAWHPKRWWNFCMSEDEKKRKRTNFYWGVVKACVSIIRHWGIKTYCLLRHQIILSPKFIKILSYIKFLCIIFILNWFEYFDQKIREFLSKKVSIPPDQYMSKGARCFNIPMSYTTYITNGHLNKYVQWQY